MGRNARESLHIDRRRQQVAELYLQSHSQAEIAAQLGVSQGTVSHDLRAIRRLWRDSSVRDFDEAVSLELTKLQRLEREAWKGWNRSLEPAEATKVTQEGSARRAEKTVRQQQGDPRFLEQVQRCIGARRALLGLDAPTRIAPTSPDGGQAYHAHVMAELMRLAEQSKDGPLIVDDQYIRRYVDRLAERAQDSLSQGDQR